jgi:hypothetical protein
MGCEVEIAPKLLMCPAHWQMVPKSLQQKVWASYRKGQEITKTPSKDYVTAAMNAVRYVARREENCG